MFEEKYYKIQVSKEKKNVDKKNFFLSLLWNAIINTSFESALSPDKNKFSSLIENKYKKFNLYY